MLKRHQFSAVLAISPNPGRALAQLRGQPLALRPFVSVVGEAQAGQWRIFQVEIVNFSGRVVHLVRGSADCACRVGDELPVSVPADGTVVITIAGRFAGKPGRFQQQFHLYTDCPEQPLIVGRFAGRVLAE